MWFRRDFYGIGSGVATRQISRPDSGRVYASSSLQDWRLSQPEL